MKHLFYNSDLSIVFVSVEKEALSLVNRVWLIFAWTGVTVCANACVFGGIRKKKSFSAISCKSV